jgi:hypothetical protein
MTEIARPCHSSGSAFVVGTPTSKRSSFRLDDMRERLRLLEERGLKKRQLALEAMIEVSLSDLSSLTLPLPFVALSLTYRHSREPPGSASDEAQPPSSSQRPEAGCNRTRRSTEHF